MCVCVRVVYTIFLANLRVSVHDTGYMYKYRCCAFGNSYETSTNQFLTTISRSPPAYTLIVSVGDIPAATVKLP